MPNSIKLKSNVGKALYFFRFNVKLNSIQDAMKAKLFAMTQFGGRIMLLAGICENDSVQNRYYKQITERYLKGKEEIQYSVKSFLNFEELLDAVNINKFDFIELDIEIGKEVNGIDIARTINIISPSTKIIFISEYDKYYPEIYNAKHSYFVEKDKADLLLPKALSVCFENYYGDKANEMLTLKYKGDETIVPKLNILYIEKQLRLSKFCLINNQETKVYMDFKTVVSAR